MVYTDQDKNFIEENAAEFSVDDILADFYTDRRRTAAAVRAPEDEDVRVYVPGGAKKKKPPVSDVGDTFAAAFSALEQQEKDYAAMAEEFASYDFGAGCRETYAGDNAPRVQEQESYYDRYSASRTDEEEIRAYLASLSEEEIERMSAESEVYEKRYKNPVEEPFEPEIDSRFNIGKDVFRNNSSIRYGGKELDLSAEPDYEPSVQSSYSPSHWSEGEGEMRDEPEETKGRGRRKKRSRKEKNSPASYAQPRYSEEEDEYARSFRDYKAGDTEYAEAGDYASEYNDELEKLGAEADFFPSSFKEYIFSMLTSFLFRMRGGASSSATAEEDDEELGAELSPAAASKYYGSHIRSMRLRSKISLGILALMCYISFGLPVPGMLGHYAFASAALMGMQLTVMILCLDVFTGAFMNIGQGRAGADTLAAISCIVTTVDASLVSIGTVNGHLPLCAVSTLSLVGVMLSALYSAKGLRRSIRVPAIGKISYAVTGEMGVRKDGITLLKSMRPSAGFVRRAEETPPDESYFSKAFLPMLLVAVLLALIVAAVKKSFGDMIYILSAILSPMAPFAALLCFALPFFIGTSRIFSSGAAIAGWSGLSDIGQSKNLIVTDRDLFPESCVEIESVRIFADEDAKKVIAYAGTMVAATGSAISGSFAELMIKNGCTMRQVEDFELLSGGGMKGIIEGDHVVCGNTDLMRLLNIRFPSKIVGKNTVLLAINKVIYGLFEVKYEPKAEVRKALVHLMRSSRHPIFAIRDFNITPEMLHKSFDIATDGYDFPPYVERFDISSAKPSEDSKIAAVVCREGLDPLTHMADTGRNMYLTVRFNLVITALSAVIGAFAVFIKLMTVGYVSIGFILGFMLLWALPVFAASIFMRG